jgi:hypothetical protein
MDKPISVGDLVQVVTPCCDMVRGWTFTVTVIQYRTWQTQCDGCGHKAKGYYAAKADSAGPHGEAGCPVPFLKRIPPLDELDDVRTEDEVTA